MSGISVDDRAAGALLGLACGDAVGTTLEFTPRELVEPITDMNGGGPFHLKPGEWTDDTSMALCLADSLLERNGFDADDQLRRYTRWFREGYLSSNGRCFDVGGTVADALHTYSLTGSPNSGSTDPGRAGNGSIMRLAPVVLFYHPDREAIDAHAAASSRTTHGADEAVAGCRMLAGVLHALLAGSDRDAAVRSVPPAEWMSDRLRSIASAEYVDRLRDSVRGTGYVVDSLEAALWCFVRTASFRDAVLEAANLGDDADTTAAVTGQLAGARYGLSDIPVGWLRKLAMRERIETWARALIAATPE